MYECPRCEYTSVKKPCMRNHFKRKIPCVVSKLDISLENCKIRLEEGDFKLKKQKVVYNCQFCTKKFDRESRLFKHYKICKTIEKERIMFISHIPKPKQDKTHNFVYILQEREFIKSGEPI